jgi:NAD(P)-dependent dehydrogenase (short-subunit alcohol dehydrogenase family)
MPRRLSDPYGTAFVTGAASGLGRAFAEMLVAEGARVWGTSRDPAKLAGTSLPKKAPRPHSTARAWRRAVPSTSS